MFDELLEVLGLKKKRSKTPFGGLSGREASLLDLLAKRGHNVGVNYDSDELGRYVMGHDSVKLGGQERFDPSYLADKMGLYRSMVMGDAKKDSSFVLAHELGHYVQEKAGQSLLQREADEIGLGLLRYLDGKKRSDRMSAPRVDSLLSKTLGFKY